MSRFFKKQGFTLIELMVVIVIIGVLASLAIPRFTEASSKAKVAEAPRVLASFESGYLAAVAELGMPDSLALNDLVFEIPTDSRWWTYKGDKAKTAKGIKGLGGEAKSDMGKVKIGGQLQTIYADTCFTHTVGGDDKLSTDVAKKMVPNFYNGGCTNKATALTLVTP
jgi:prepilin-type N-terminal cleavage/methylation domain-containing protein